MISLLDPYQVGPHTVVEVTGEIDVTSASVLRDRLLALLPTPSLPRAGVIAERYGAVVSGRAPLHGGQWAMATLEVCLAMLESARERRDVVLGHQVGLPS